MFRVALLTLFTTLHALALTISPISLPLEAVVLPDAHGVAKPASPDNPIILQIDIKDMITSITWEHLEQILWGARNGVMRDYNIKALLLMVNSDLGSPSYAGLMFDYLRQFVDRLNIPIYAYVAKNSIGSGYFVSCAADVIFCADSAQIGGIGVINTPFLNFRNNLTIEQRFEELQIAQDPEIELLFEGTYKNTVSPFAIWDAQFFANAAAQTEVAYNQFISTIASRRPALTIEIIRDQLGARQFTGIEAQQLGLVDAAAQSRASTIEALSIAAGIAEDYRVVELIRTDI